MFAAPYFPDTLEHLKADIPLGLSQQFPP